MGEPEDRTPSISLSRETLRTEIRLANAELELRLRTYLTTELEKKASAQVVANIQRDLATLSRAVGQGEFTAAQNAAIREHVEAMMAERSAVGWTKRERIIAVCGLLFWVCSIAISLYALLGR